MTANMNDNDSSSLKNDHDNNDSEYDESDEEDDEYSSLVQSERSKTGLEVGVRVTWPFLHHRYNQPSRKDSADENGADCCVVAFARRPVSG